MVGHIDTKEPVTDRKVRGMGLAMIGVAVILSLLYWVAWDRSSHFMRGSNLRPWNPPNEIWAIAVLGIIFVVAGIRMYRPSVGQSLMAVGTIVTLVGAFQYWWTDGFFLPDGPSLYPTVNWAFTIPVTLVGLVVLGAGIRLLRKTG